MDEGQRFAAKITHFEGDNHLICHLQWGDKFTKGQKEDFLRTLRNELGKVIEVQAQ